MIKEKNMKCNRTMLALIFLLLIINAVYWGYRKEGFHGDELYSYQFICEVDYPSINANRNDSEYLNNWHDSSYYDDYLTISESEAFDLSGTYMSIVEDVHPPIFYVLLELVCSLFFENIFSKWSGIFLNLIFYILTLSCLYKLSLRLTNSRWWAGGICVAYGLSVGAISTLVFIRMYMILTYASLLLVYSNVLLWDEYFSIQQNKSRSKRYLLLLFSVVLGGMTQYYFFVFAFFVCAIFWLFLISRKKYRFSIEYATTVCVALAISFFAWPDIFNDIFGGYRGREAISNLSSETSWTDVVGKFVEIINNELFSGYAKEILFLLILLLVIGYLRKRYEMEKYRIDNGGYRVNVRKKIKNDSVVVKIDAETILIFQLTISVSAYVFLIARIAPYQIDRYVFNVFPFIVLAVMFSFKKVISYLENKKIIIVILTICLSVITLLGYKKIGVNYLYEGTKQQLEIIQNYSDKPAILLSTDNRRFESCVNSIYLRHSSKVYVATEDTVDFIKNIIRADDYNEIVIYLDKKFSDKEAILANIFENIKAQVVHEYLFSTDQSVVYSITLN